MGNEERSENTCMIANCSDLMKECSNLAYRIPIFLSHPSRLNTKQMEFHIFIRIYYF